MEWMGVVVVLALLAVAAWGVWTASRSPSFWLGMLHELFQKAKPYILKRKTPEEEKKWRDEYAKSPRDKGSD